MTVTEYVSTHVLSYCILQLGARRMRLDHFTPGERVPTPIEQEAVWDPGQVWMWWIQVKSLAVTGFELRTVQPVVYSLYRLPVPGMQVCNCVLPLSEA